MERKPKDYSNGKIYCIRNNIDDQIYIGSTCQSLSKRMAYHRSDAKKQDRQNTLIYPLMLRYGTEHFYIELIEEYPCENSYQLEKREGELIREMKASLNMKVSGRTLEEYKIECADKIKQSKTIRNKKYRENHLDKIKQNDEEYIKNNVEKIKAYRKEYYWSDAEKFKERARKYNEEHREEIKMRNREYYLRKKEHILERVRKYAQENRDKVLANKRDYHRRKKQQMAINDMD